MGTGRNTRGVPYGTPVRIQHPGATAFNLLPNAGLGSKQQREQFAQSARGLWGLGRRAVKVASCYS